jgi:hypothetical protein
MGARTEGLKFYAASLSGQRDVASYAILADQKLRQLDAMICATGGAISEVE